VKQDVEILSKSAKTVTFLFNLSRAPTVTGPPVYVVFSQIDIDALLHMLVLLMTNDW